MSLRATVAAFAVLACCAALAVTGLVQRGRLADRDSVDGGTAGDTVEEAVPVPGEITLALTSAEPRAVRKVERALRARLPGARLSPLSGTRVATIRVPVGAEDDAVAALRGVRGVDVAERTWPVQLAAPDPNDPAFDVSRSLGARLLRDIGLPAVWERPLEPRRRMTVAVVDTGVSPSRDLPGSRLTKPRANIVSGKRSVADTNGHGTKVASIIAAVRNNNRGISGICDRCRIMPVKVFANTADGQAPQSTSAHVAAGIEWAARKGADVINVSAGTVAGPRTKIGAYRRAVTFAKSRGAFVVAAAGNSDRRRAAEPWWPAAYGPTLSVAASSTRDARLPTSNGGPNVDFAAPGAAIPALNHNGSTVAMSGTSAAAPVLSGIAALHLGQLDRDAQLSPAQLTGRLAALTRKVRYVSVGRIDAAGAMDRFTMPTVTLEPLSPETDGWLRGVQPLRATVDDLRPEAVRVEFKYDDQRSVRPATAAGEAAGSWDTTKTEENEPQTLYAVAVDSAGNRVRTGAQHLTVDNTVPLVRPAEPAQGSDQPGTLPLAVDVDEHNVRDVEFFVNEDGSGFRSVGHVSIADADGLYRLPWSAQGSLDGEDVQFYARVVDHAGNRSNVATTPSRTFHADNVAPTLELLSPAEDQLFVNAVQALSAAATDGTLDEVAFYVDCDPSTSDACEPARTISAHEGQRYDVPWSSLGIPDGPHAVYARAVDRAGNQRMTAAAQVTADTVPPVVVVRPEGDVNDGVVGHDVRVSAAADDATAGVAEVEFFVDGASIGTAQEEPFEVDWPPSAEGEYDLEAVATDRAGNESRSGAVIVTRDLTGPDVVIDEPSDDAVLSGEVALSASTLATDATSVTFSLSPAGGGEPVVIETVPVDDNRVAATTYDMTLVPDGFYTLAAEGEDHVGNRASSAPRTVAVANVQFTTPRDGASVTVGELLRVEVDTSREVDEVAVTIAGRSCAVPQDLVTPELWTGTCDTDGLPAGPVTLEAIATRDGDVVGRPQVTIELVEP